MKRIIAFVLVFAMLACMIPVIAVTAAEEPEVRYGLNADFYQLSGIANDAAAYRNVIGSVGEGSTTDYADTQRFDQSIEQLLAISTEVTTTKDINQFPITLPGFNAGGELDWDGYMIKWTGTVTATTPGTYYLVGYEIDNGFVAKVKQGNEMKKVYEYWSGHHWFDGTGHVVYTNLGGFTLEANTPTEIEFWYMESNGGQVLNMGIATEPNGSGTSFSDAGIRFDVEGTLYRTNIKIDHDMINNQMIAGTNASGNTAVDDNDCQADIAANHTFDATYENVKKLMTKIGSAVVPSFDTESHAYGKQFGMYGDQDLDDVMIEYSGYMIPTTSGTYQFGTNKVDNCLMVEIEVDGEWVTVYEFWAKNIFNDRSATFYNESVALEADVAYPIRVVFLEINGGQPIEAICKIGGGTATGLKSAGIVFTTEKPSAPVAPTTVSFFERGAEWYYMTSGDEDLDAPADGWKVDASVYSEWQTASADLGANGSNVWNTSEVESDVGNKGIWAVKEFEVEDLSAISDWSLMTQMFFDDNIHLYINGTEVFTHGTWNNGYETYKFVNKAGSVLKEGKNVIAVELWQGHGGYGIDLNLYATLEDTSIYTATYIPAVEIATADDLLAFVASVNADPTATSGQVVTIVADIDMAGKTWTPMDAFYGKLEGNGHTISNITYKPTVDATGNEDENGMPIGLLVNVLGNEKGQIVNLTLDNCTLEVSATDGESTAEWVIAGLFAGAVDAGYISNCTVTNSTVKGATVAGGIAGVACGAYDGGGVYVQNCTVIGTTVSAKRVAGGIIGYARGEDPIIINKTTFADLTLEAQQSDYVYGGLWDTELNYDPIEEVQMEKPAFKQEITLEAGENFQLFSQSRPNAFSSVHSDFRVIIVANTAWLEENYSKGFVISFTDGTTTKKLEAVPTTFYKNVTADNDETQDLYSAVGDTAIVGWIVTEVPAGFSPSVTIGNNTYAE